jgi:hypothetical protein
MSSIRKNLSNNEFLWLWKDDGVSDNDKMSWATNYLGKNHLAIGLDKSKLRRYLSGEVPVKASPKLYLFIERMKRAYAQYRRRFEKASISFSVKHEAAEELNRLSAERQLPISTIVEQMIYEKLNDIGVMTHEPVSIQFGPTSHGLMNKDNTLQNP